MTTTINGKEVFPIQITWVYQAWNVSGTLDGKLVGTKLGHLHTTSHGAYKELEDSGIDEGSYFVQSIPITRNTELERINCLHFN